MDAEVGTRSAASKQNRAVVVALAVLGVTLGLGGYAGWRLSATRSLKSVPQASTPAAAPAEPATVIDRARVATPGDDEETGVWVWSNQCYRRWSEGDLVTADHLCDQGLRQPDAQGKVRAALYYNKGLIAEKRGDTEGAARYFVISLRLRTLDDPGRVYVQRALDRVNGRR